MEAETLEKLKNKRDLGGRHVNEERVARWVRSAVCRAPGGSRGGWRSRERVPWGGVKTCPSASDPSHRIWSWIYVTSILHR